MHCDGAPGAHDPCPSVSVVVPVRNEVGNIEPLIGEIEAALHPAESFEIIVVDDGSTDGTGALLKRLARSSPELRPLSHAQSCGQSAAIRTGVRAARGPIIVTLDGDGQNDPAFIPALLRALRRPDRDIGMAAGQRRGRRDSGFKKVQSRIANAVRSRILGDGATDTGCGLKAIWRDVYLALPYFDALHRFMPALVKREGFSVVFVEVIDRSRRSGRSNYGLMDRFWIGLVDLAGVWWLMRRKRHQAIASGWRPHDC